MEVQFNRESIQGWGIDLKPEDRPAYPMWKYQEDTGSHYDESTIPKQEMKFTKLMSIERPHMPPVFGQTVPPTLLSGLIRKFAFRYSEGSFGHWLPLLMADRVNMIEGIFDDLLHLHVPNVFKEMGLKAEWKYNRSSFVKKTVLVTALFAGVIGIMAASSRNSTRQS
ncbi:MAG: hypothetical protein ACJ76H_12000 [Bacteriovoracaceae bacterium]